MVLDRLARDAIALADRDSQDRRRGRAVLGIAGNPGAGKSTLVELLLSRIAAIKGDQWVAHVPMDGFHLADAQLDRLGNRDRKGAPDTFDADGYAHLLERIVHENATPVYAPGFDRTLEQPLAAALVVLPSARLVITEGNYLLLEEPRWARARAAMDSVWFVASEEDAARPTARRAAHPVRQDPVPSTRLGGEHRPTKLRFGVDNPR